MVAALCASFGILFFTNDVAFVGAEIVAGTTPTLSATKILKSSDGTMMLLATGINDLDDCYECGYVTKGLSAVTYNTAKYYTSISTKSGGLWTAEDIFGQDYNGMIVWEVKNVSTETVFKPYVKVGERENGVLYPTEPVTFVYGTQREAKGKAALPDVSDSFVFDDLSDYDSGVATLEFDVHLEGDDDELLFRLADDENNYYGTYRINNA